jgi:hypothetical protein
MRVGGHRLRSSRPSAGFVGDDGDCGQPTVAVLAERAARSTHPPAGTVWMSTFLANASAPMRTSSAVRHRRVTIEAKDLKMCGQQAHSIPAPRIYLARRGFDDNRPCPQGHTPERSSPAAKPVLRSWPRRRIRRVSRWHWR